MRILIGLICAVAAAFALLYIDKLEVFAFSLIPISYTLLTFIIRFFISALIYTALFLVMKPFLSRLGRFYAAVKYFLLLIALVLPLLLALPDALYLKLYSYRTSVNSDKFQSIIVQSEDNPYDLAGQKKILCFYSPGCKFCKLAARKLSVIRQKYQIPKDQIVNVFFGREESIQQFYEPKGISQVPYHFIPAADFIDITKGKMPVVMLVEDGEILVKFRYRSIDEKKIAEFVKS